MPLVERMRSERPIYGVDARGLGGKSTPLRDIDAMADIYAAAIQDLEPTGPYFVVGWSMGGAVAIEVARRLERVGHGIERVVMIDVFAPDVARSLMPPELIENRQLLTKLASDLSLDAEATESFLAQWLSTPLGSTRDAQTVEALWRLACERDPGLAGDDRDAQLGPYLTVMAHKAAMRAYRPAPYGGAVELVAARQPLVANGKTRRADKGWDVLLPDLSVTLVDGDHRSLVVGEPAAQVAELLDRWAAVVASASAMTSTPDQAPQPAHTRRP